MRTELVTLKRQTAELLSDIPMQQRMTVLEGMARGEQAIAEGRVVTHAHARMSLAKWMKRSDQGRR